MMPRSARLRSRSAIRKGLKSSVVMFESFFAYGAVAQRQIHATIAQLRSVRATARQYNSRIVNGRKFSTPAVAANSWMSFHPQGSPGPSEGAVRT